jgi:hypothetical protein
MQQKGNWVGPLTTWVTSVKSTGHNPKVCQWSSRGTATYKRCVALRAMSEGERMRNIPEEIDASYKKRLQASIEKGAAKQQVSIALPHGWEKGLHSLAEDGEVALENLANDNTKLEANVTKGKGKTRVRNSPHAVVKKPRPAASSAASASASSVAAATVASSPRTEQLASLQDASDDEDDVTQNTSGLCCKLAEANIVRCVVWLVAPTTHASCFLLFASCA